MRVEKSRSGLPVPTNGHPTRKAAIIELYEAGMQQKLIAAKLGCSRHNVSQTIFDYRQKTGRYVETVITEPRKFSRPSVREHVGPREPTRAGYRLLNYRKSTSGAREALRAMGALS